MRHSSGQAGGDILRGKCSGENEYRRLHVRVRVRLRMCAPVPVRVCVRVREMNAGAAGAGAGGRPSRRAAEPRRYPQKIQHTFFKRNSPQPDQARESFLLKNHDTYFQVLGP